MNSQAENFIEHSFLAPLIEDANITDITYNGVGIFYVHNKKGRKKSDIKITSSEVLDFIRQIANFTEKQFSFTTPTLDVSVGKYRLNAIHPSIVRVQKDKSCSFAMRVGSSKCRIKGDSEFMTSECEEYLLNALNRGDSIVIAGATGSGKTELQKYLLGKLRKYSRVIVIDNIQELENLRENEDLDLTCWQVSLNNPNSSIQELIRNALRSNPDWIVVAEARGKEMNEVLNSVMTGHPIITTIHAKSLEVMPSRMTRMVMGADATQQYQDVFADICEHIKVYVYLNRELIENGNVRRYIDSIGEISNDGKMKIIYKRIKNEDN